ncbi:MAG: flagellar biosynthesis protein FlhF [Solirubrobacterales bacterium]
MKIKRFVADSFQEAMSQAKTEMGKDAIILHSRRFKEGGFMGLFSRQRFEITVAIDEGTRTKLDAARPSEKRGFEVELKAETFTDDVKAILAAAGAAGDETKLTARDIPETPAVYQPVTKPAAPVIPRQEPVFQPQQAPGGDLANERVEDVLDEIRNVREAVENLMVQVETKEKNKPVSRGGQALLKLLLANQVDERLAVKIVKAVEEQMEAEGSKDVMLARELGMQAIVDMFKKPRPIEVKGKKVRVVAMIGPTGVGKTTTIAKLAANFTLLDHKKVALITVDTYRIAAVEQLKTYADIIGVPLEVVFNPEDMRQSIKKFQGKDIVFVDTAGRSPRNEAQLNELKKYLEAIEPDEVILVLAATTRMEDLLETYRCFNVTRIDKVIFTKLDETSSYGPLLSVVHRTRSPISYITNGQNVPDDIELLDEFRLARMVLGDEQAL